MKTLVMLLGLLLPIFSSLVYGLSIVRGDTRPQRMTRFLMFVIGLLAFATLSTNYSARASMLFAAFSLLQAILLWLLSLKYGVGGRGRLDIVCLVFCFIGLGLWLTSGRAVLGLWMSIVADFLACIPSIAKIYQLPNSESWPFYALDAIAGVCIVFVSPSTPLGIIYPLYITFINGLFVWLILFRGRSSAV